MCSSPPQDTQRFIPRERISDISKVDHIDNLLRGHVGDQAPNRFSGTASGHIPRGVDHRTNGHVHDTLLGTEPAKLRVVSQTPSKTAQVMNHIINPPPDNKRPQRRQRGCLHIVATPNREHEPVPTQSMRIVATQNNIRRRIIRIRIHGVGSIELARSRKADVVSFQISNQRHDCIHGRSNDRHTRSGDPSTDGRIGRMRDLPLL